MLLLAGSVVLVAVPAIQVDTLLSCFVPQPVKTTFVVPAATTAVGSDTAANVPNLRASTTVMIVTMPMLMLSQSCSCQHLDLT